YYSLRWNGNQGIEHVIDRLTDFSYLQARTGVFPASDITSLLGDYEFLLKQISPEDPDRIEAWAAFFRENIHILRRGTPQWPANKILLQLAVEHADDSPVTMAAESWLAAGNCDWVWLRDILRSKQLEKSPCLGVLEGHTAPAKGALQLFDNRIASWSEDTTLRIWAAETGMEEKLLKGHVAAVKGALELSDDRLVSWSDDTTIRIWNIDTGECLYVLSGKHALEIEGVLILPDQRLLSWAKENEMRIWSFEGEYLSSLRGHMEPVKGCIVLSDQNILSFADDKTLRKWDLNTYECITTFAGHEGGVKGASIVSDDQIFSWAGGMDRTLRIWDTKTGDCLTELKGHDDPIQGAIPLSNNRILSWSDPLVEMTIIIWNVQTGECQTKLNGQFEDVRLVSDDRIVTWAGGFFGSLDANTESPDYLTLQRYLA
ncbi:MAG: WD40 repeat domain-containing protein, partial [Proteobacteria bacterium]|nr:WD40 repeat domain-containing protein [Pseudomonadota bacterium]